MGAAAALLGVGGLIGAAGALAAGKAQAELARFNASVARRNSKLTLEQAKRDSYLVRKEGFKFLGDIKASVGASGLTMDGSFRDVLRESARTVKRDEMTLQYNGQLQAMSFEIEAQQQEYAANAAEVGAIFNAASSILSGGSQAAGMSNLASSSRQNVNSPRRA